MAKVTKQEMDDMQALIDGMAGEPEAGRTPDSNTRAEATASQAMNSWDAAEAEMNRRNKLKKVAGQ